MWYLGFFITTPEFRWLGSTVSPAAELRAESPEPFPESEPEAWYEETRCRLPWGTKFPSWTCLHSSDSFDSDRIIDGNLDGFGGGESGAGASSSPPKNLLSAQGDRVGSLVILWIGLPFRPSVLELGDNVSLAQVPLGSECVENLEDGLMPSAPADLVMSGDCITPSALLHFSCCAIRLTSDGVSDCDLCFLDGNRGGSSLGKGLQVLYLNWPLPTGVVAGEISLLWFSMGVGYLMA